MTDRPTAETAYEDESAPGPFVLLAGATGDLGARIAEDLIARGASVRALMRTDGSPDGPTGTFVDHGEMVGRYSARRTNPMPEKTVTGVFAGCSGGPA